MATAAQKRTVATLIQESIAGFKSTVDTLKTDLDVIYTATAAFVVNGVDGDLPTELEIKAQLEALDALSVNVAKPAISASAAIAAIRAAV